MLVTGAHSGQPCRLSFSSTALLCSFAQLPSVVSVAPVV